MPEHVHETYEVSLFVVEKASYQSLRLIDVVYPQWIISYIYQGTLLTGSGGEQWPVTTGEIMLHPPYIPFSEIAEGPGEHWWLQFNVTGAHTIDLFQQYPIPPVLRITQSNEYCTVFSQLQQSWKRPDPAFREVLVSALTIQLCGLVLESWRHAGSPPRPESLRTPRDRFVEIIRYMTTHLDKKITRDELAGLACLHPGYFDRVFRGIYGVAPMQMLRELRLQQAARLLETSDMALAGIAYRCGLGDAGYLHRVFRQRYGQTPGRYRQSAKSAMESYIHPL